MTVLLVWTFQMSPTSIVYSQQLSNTSAVSIFVVANAGIELTGKPAHKITFRPTMLVRGRSLITVRPILLVARRQP